MTPPESPGLPVQRKNGRIYFGVGDKQWSVRDPVLPDGELSNHARDNVMASDWHYLVAICPSYSTAVKKLSLIRWAVRNVKPGESKLKPAVRWDEP